MGQTLPACEDCEDCGTNAAQVMPPQNEAAPCATPNPCATANWMECIFLQGEDILCGLEVVIPADTQVAEAFSILTARICDIELTPGPPGNVMIEVTYTALAALASGGTLSVGSTYFITDRDYYVQALSTTEISNIGQRIQTILTNTAYVVGGDNLSFWNSGLAPIAGETVTWGGKSWTNTSGNVGTATNSYTLSGADWAVNTVFNQLKTFTIHYDFQNDWVALQIDDKGNKLGRAYTVAGVNPVDISDWGKMDIYQNQCYGVYNNDVTAISRNIVFGNIENNNITGEIASNVVTGNMSSNTNTGNIFRNRVTSSLSNNSNTGDITENITGSRLSGNSNTGDITNNITQFVLEVNSNEGGIVFNQVDGINNNSNNGDISYNTNNGHINNNTSNVGTTLDIENNSNNGHIEYNNSTANINIFYNINNGYIGTAPGPNNRIISITDTIVNK